MKNGPTEKIIEMARSAPGGVIRWRDARAEYIKGSPSARKELQSRTTRFHMGIKRVLDRHFTRVEGTDGYYVLTESIDE